MSVSTPCDPNSPLMRAWEAYKLTEDFANSKKWALYKEHVDGSLWAAFMEGFNAALRARAEGEAVALADRWAFVLAALEREHERNEKAGEMFPQVADEHREDRRAFARTITHMCWAAANNMPLPELAHPLPSGMRLVPEEFIDRMREALLEIASDCERNRMPLRASQLRAWATTDRFSAAALASAEGEGE